MQRAGKFHKAGLGDGGNDIRLSSLIKVVREAQADLENAGEEDAALRFEIFGDFLEEDVVNGASLEYKPRVIGL